MKGLLKMKKIRGMRSFIVLVSLACIFVVICSFLIVYINLLQVKDIETGAHSYTGTAVSEGIVFGEQSNIKAEQGVEQGVEQVNSHLGENLTFLAEFFTDSKYAVQIDSKRGYICNMGDTVIKPYHFVYTMVVTPQQVILSEIDTPDIICDSLGNVELRYDIDGTMHYIYNNIDTTTKNIYKLEELVFENTPVVGEELEIISDTVYQLFLSYIVPVNKITGYLKFSNLDSFNTFRATEHYNFSYNHTDVVLEHTGYMTWMFTEHDILSGLQYVAEVKLISWENIRKSDAI